MISLKPRISVVIVNYNGARFLKDCLDSLHAQTISDFEIVIVDNNSLDRSVRIITEAYPDVVLIRNKANLGFAAGTNQGIRVAQGEYILTLNNDTRVEPSFLEEIVGPMDDDLRVCICASKMLLPDGRINSTGLCISRSGAAWNRGMFERDSGQYAQQEEVFGASAGAALYRKTMLDEIGLFDEDFFMYMEDVDLSFRARLAGWKCLFVPTAVVYHHHGGTAEYGSDMAVYYGNRNIIWMVVKNYPTGFLITSLPWIIGRTIGVIGYYALKGQVRVIVSSKINAMRGLNLSVRKRKMNIQTTQNHKVFHWVCTWYSPGRIGLF